MYNVPKISTERVAKSWPCGSAHTHSSYRFVANSFSRVTPFSVNWNISTGSSNVVLDPKVSIILLLPNTRNNRIDMLCCFATLRTGFSCAFF